MNAGVEIPLPEPLQGKPTEDRVTLGIRPEAFDLTEKDASPVVSGTVKVIELTGDVQVIHVNVGEQTILAKLPAAIELDQGDYVYLSVDNDRIHLFDGISNESPRIER